MPADESDNSSSAPGRAAAPGERRGSVTAANHSSNSTSGSKSRTDGSKGRTTGRTGNSSNSEKQRRKNSNSNTTAPADRDSHAVDGASCTAQQQQLQNQTKGALHSNSTNLQGSTSDEHVPQIENSSTTKSSSSDIGSSNCQQQPGRSSSICSHEGRSTNPVEDETSSSSTRYARRGHSRDRSDRSPFDDSSINNRVREAPSSCDSSVVETTVSDLPHPPRCETAASAGSPAASAATCAPREVVAAPLVKIIREESTHSPTAAAVSLPPSPPQPTADSASFSFAAVAAAAPGAPAELADTDAGGLGSETTAVLLPLTVKLISGQLLSVTVDPSVSVETWKEELEELVDIPAAEQRLVAGGRVLQDARSVASYSLQPQATVHLLHNPAAAAAVAHENDASGAREGGGHTAVAATRATASSTRMHAPLSPAAAAAAALPTRGISSAQISELGHQGGGGVWPFFPGTAAASHASQGQQQQQHSGDFLQQLLQSNVMQPLTDSPDFLRMLFESNPQLQQLREQNPELNHLLADPQIFQQSVQMVRNPALQREMMRSTDRAMANIEALPGGFNALMRMYHTIQEPMFEATFNAAGGGQTSDGAGAGSADSVGAADAQQQIYERQRNRTSSLEAMPNPWAEPSLGAGVQEPHQQLDRLFDNGRALFPLNFFDGAQQANLLSAMFPGAAAASSPSPAAAMRQWQQPPAAAAAASPSAAAAAAAPEDSCSGAAASAVASTSVASSPEAAIAGSSSGAAAPCPQAAAVLQQQQQSRAEDETNGSGGNPTEQQEEEVGAAAAAAALSPSAVFTLPAATGYPQQQNSLLLMDLLRSSFRNTLDISQLGQQLQRMALHHGGGAAAAEQQHVDGAAAHENQTQEHLLQQQLQQQQQQQQMMLQGMFFPQMLNGNPLIVASPYAAATAAARNTAAAAGTAGVGGAVAPLLESATAAGEAVLPQQQQQHTGRSAAAAADAAEERREGDVEPGTAARAAAGASNSSSNAVPHLSSMRYEPQLGALRSMGFTDTSQCLRALELAGAETKMKILQDQCCFFYCYCLFCYYCCAAPSVAAASVTAAAAASTAAADVSLAAADASSSIAAAAASSTAVAVAAGNINRALDMLLNQQERRGS